MYKLARIGGGTGYWLALMVLGVALEATALFYQYVLNYFPCVICIHVRIGVLGLVVAALLGLFLRHTRATRFFGHLLVSVVLAWLLERSWMLLAVERGTVDGSCDFDAGLPAWFALDQWFPLVFKVWEACGYTPQMGLGVSMAEVLVALFAGLAALSIALSIATLWREA